MSLLIVILLFVALGCFLAAAFGLAARINLLAFGLACWVATVIIERLG